MDGSWIGKQRKVKENKEKLRKTKERKDRK